MTLSKRKSLISFGGIKEASFGAQNNKNKNTVCLSLLVLGTHYMKYNDAETNCIGSVRKQLC